jgi:hypothetical protein
MKTRCFVLMLCAAAAPFITSTAWAQAAEDKTPDPELVQESKAAADKAAADKAACKATADKAAACKAAKDETAACKAAEDEAAACKAAAEKAAQDKADALVQESKRAKTAEDKEKVADKVKDLDPKLQEPTVARINEEDAKEFWTYFGVGLVIDQDLGSDTPVKNASISGGIVHVDEEDDVKLGLALEVHKFVVGLTWNDKGAYQWSGGLALGPYVAVVPGTNEIIDAVGAGLAVGFIGGEATTGISMNLAIGGYIDPETRVLADGFKDGHAPPTGETSVRFKDVTQYGIQAVLSFGYAF